MVEFFSIGNLVTLVLLVLLQAILGFDNLLYISLESKRAPAHQQDMVRKVGIGLAVVFRVFLLFALMRIVNLVQDPIFEPRLGGVLEGSFNLHSIIVLVGGVFIIYTSTKEILHMMNLEHADAGAKGERSAVTSILWIVAMNLVFSFDSILSAIALSDVFPVMAAAVVIGGLLMIWLSSRVATFLQRNRLYEVLGLFVLFVVGIMLLTEGGHLAHLTLFGNKITAMSKTTFYFVIAVLVLTDIVQGRYQKRLMRTAESA